MLSSIKRFFPTREVASQGPAGTNGAAKYTALLVRPHVLRFLLHRIMGG